MSRTTTTRQTDRRSSSPRHRTPAFVRGIPARTWQHALGPRP
jgi:hypothetical protein